MDIRQGFKEVPYVKVMFNIGALLDIPTGSYLIGRHGESILNGGLALLTGLMGRNNMFKSTVCHFMMLAAADHVMSAIDTSMATHDTEGNAHVSRLLALSQKFDQFIDKDIIEEGFWSISDRTVYTGDEWYAALKEYMAAKVKNASSLLVETPFLDKDKKSLLKIITPTFGELDSLSEFSTKQTLQMQDDNDVGDSANNTLYMKLGNAKQQLVMDMATHAARANHHMLMTAHVDKEIQIAQGPFAAPPKKQFQHLKGGEVTKGVSRAFMTLINNGWHVYNAAVLMNQSTKGPEYPKYSDDKDAGSTDLNTVNLRQLRGKSGQSGLAIELVVSQIEGVLPSLTEFHYIKTNDRFGISGNNSTYALDLLPSLTLSRPTIRQKIDTNPKLRRALNITAELCQIKQLWKHVDPDFLCTPAELYEDLKQKGYDWDILLNTRGWWTFNNDDHPIPFLSTWDLLRMRKGLYHPFWMKDKPKGK